MTLDEVHEGLTSEVRTGTALDAFAGVLDLLQLRSQVSCSLEESFECVDLKIDLLPSHAEVRRESQRILTSMDNSHSLEAQPVLGSRHGNHWIHVGV